jgi:hypothetical protein
VRGRKAASPQLAAATTSAHTVSRTDARSSIVRCRTTWLRA